MQSKVLYININLTFSPSVFFNTFRKNNYSYGGKRK